MPLDPRNRALIRQEKASRNAARVKEVLEHARAYPKLEILELLAWIKSRWGCSSTIACGYILEAGSLAKATAPPPALSMFTTETTNMSQPTPDKDPTVRWKIKVNGPQDLRETENLVREGKLQHPRLPHLQSKEVIQKECQDGEYYFTVRYALPEQK